MMLGESPTNNLPLMPSRATTASNDGAPLTRVSLLYIEQRFNLYLRFGCPLRVHQIDRWRRCAVFSPAQLFCRIRWESNDYGTTRWQLLVLRSGRPQEGMQRVRGVRPGAHILLNAEGERNVRAVLSQIDAIEAQCIEPADVSPRYWRLLSNRLAARQPLPDYDADRHAAWLAERALQ
ncbi:DUF2840 domain-containing protein [Spongiibacter tropicus]|uniref:DUF2840 domain-containing protein n=1 Tax=Spongiibacter tropicus TaxID=454602 RepID=UPI003D6B386E